MGRSTYEFIEPFAEWPYQGKPVHVLSTTLADGRRPADHRAPDVRRGGRGARRRPDTGGSTSTAGARCTRSSRAGLIADLTLSRVPVLIGTGHTPFGELAADIPLEHVRTQTFAGGMVQSTYRVRAPA